MRAIIGHIDITIDATGAVYVNALSYPAFRPDHTEEHLNFDLLLATHAKNLQATLRRDPEDLGITASARRLLEVGKE